MVDLPRALPPSDAERLAVLRQTTFPGGVSGESRNMGPGLDHGHQGGGTGVGGGDSDGIDGLEHYSEILKATAVAPVAGYELTYDPSSDPHWPQVFAGGALQQVSVDYTIDGVNLTVLDAMRLRAAEALRVDYDYLSGVPRRPSDGLPIIVGDTWRYATGLGSSSTYAASDFDDSAWSEGASPFGWGGTPGTAVPDPMDVWTRRSFHLGHTADLDIHLRVDNHADIYIDGVLLHGQTSINDLTTYNWTDTIGAGDHIVAVYGSDDGMGGARLYVWMEIS